MPGTGQRRRSVVQARQVEKAAQKNGAPPSAANRKRKVTTLVTRQLKRNEAKRAVREVAADGLCAQDVAAMIVGGMELCRDRFEAKELSFKEYANLYLAFAKEARLHVADNRSKTGSAYDAPAQVIINLGGERSAPRNVTGPGSILEISS